MAQKVGHPKGKIEQMAAPFVTAGSVVVDVGANIGQFSKWAAQIVGPTGKVLAIEPDPRCEALRVDTYPHVERFRGAVGAWTVPGQATLYQTSESPVSTLLRAAMPEPQRQQATETLVPVTCLDALVEHADLVKIDAQGLDRQVLQGATQLLQTCPTWIVECWPVGLKAAQTTPQALWRDLVGAGFTVCFADGIVVTEDSLAAWLTTDQIFVNWLATR